MKITHAALCVVFLAAPVAAFAQTEAGFMVNGVVSSQPPGRAVAFICPVTGCPVNPSASHVNAGVSFEAFLARRLAGNSSTALSIELPILGIPNRGTNLPAASFSTLAVTPGLRLNFLPKASWSPYISAGGGIVHFTGDTPSVTHGAARFGGGFDVKTPVPRLGLRFEVKDLISTWPELFPKNGVMQNVLFGGGVVLKF